MKVKATLAALVAAAFAMPAAAQIKIGDSLQIYGRANVSYERITTKDSSDTASQPNESNWDLVDNSSRVGFRGRKELTPGLIGFFQIESRVRLDEGFGDLSSRDSYAGLEGAWGIVRLGRTIGPVYYATYHYISLHNHDTGTSADALLAPATSGNQGFMNDTVWYTSPKFGGFSLDLAHSLLGGDRLPGESQPRYLGAVLSYDQGPLHVAVSHADTKGSVDVNGALPGVLPNKDKATTIGGLYDFKTFMIGALLERAESRIATGADTSRNYFRVSAVLPSASTSSTPTSARSTTGWTRTSATTAPTSGPWRTTTTSRRKPRSTLSSRPSTTTTTATMPALPTRTALRA